MSVVHRRRVARRAIAAVATWVAVFSVAGGPALAQDDAEDARLRWEGSFHFGGVAGSLFGNVDTTCNAVVVASCDPARDFGPQGGRGIGVVPSPAQGALPPLLMTGGIRPETGPLMGIRIGYDLTPSWQVELTYHYSGMTTRFVNDLRPIDLAVQLFCDPVAFDTCNFGRNLQVLDRGASRGTQQLLLVNFNHRLRREGPVQPYVGVGVGRMGWSDGPKIVVLLDNAFGGGRFTKESLGVAGFAVDLSFGVRTYVNRRFGLRAEVMNVISRPEFEHRFSSIDRRGFVTNPGGQVAPSGILRQASTVNQFLASVGVFTAF